MRHGQTVFNERELVQGFFDSPLTEHGKKQVIHTKQFFKENGVTFDYAYTSTQERASDTLELITDLPYIRLKGIKEMYFGLLEGEPIELLCAVGDYYENPDAMVQFGGESVHAVSERMTNSLTGVMNKGNHQNVLVVSHKSAIKSFLWGLDKKYYAMELNNCAVIKFEYENGKFTFLESIDHDFE